MKKIGFNAFLTTVALAAGVCSFAKMPEGRALSEQEKIVSRGLIDTCKGCYTVEGCKPPQPVPTLPPDDLNTEVLICNGIPSRTTIWSNTQQVTHSTPEYVCIGKLYRYQEVEGQGWKWNLITTGGAFECGKFSECNDEEGGWKQGSDGGVVDGRADYKKKCNNKPPTGE